MNFSKIFFFVFAMLLVACSVTAAPAPEPKWKIFKKLEKAGRRIRDGVIKAGPAVAVVGQAATVIRG